MVNYTKKKYKKSKLSSRQNMRGGGNRQLGEPSKRNENNDGNEARNNGNNGNEGSAKRRKVNSKKGIFAYIFNPTRLLDIFIHQFY